MTAELANWQKCLREVVSWTVAWGKRQSYFRFCPFVLYYTWDKLLVRGTTSVSNKGKTRGSLKIHCSLLMITIKSPAKFSVCFNLLLFFLYIQKLSDSVSIKYCEFLFLLLNAEKLSVKCLKNNLKKKKQIPQKQLAMINPFKHIDENFVCCCSEVTSFFMGVFIVCELQE